MIPLRTRLADAVRGNRNTKTEHLYSFRVEGRGKWIPCREFQLETNSKQLEKWGGQWEQEGEWERAHSIQKPWAYGALFVLC